MPLTEWRFYSQRLTYIGNLGAIMTFFPKFGWN
jgi:hypothetical protein